MPRDLVTFLALLCPVLSAAQSASGASVSGVVTNLQTAAPLAGASVVLHLHTVDNLAATAPTDTQGQFLFDNLPPGTYTLRVSHPGFDARWFGACTDEDQGVAFELHAGQNRTNINVPLPPLGAIAGTITGIAGEPLAKAFLSARPKDLVPGRTVARHVNVQHATSDDSGHFRLFGIRAGDYFVSAFSSDNAVAPAGDPQGQVARLMYQPQYYPGVLSRREATPIHLSMGEARENIDFQLLTVHAVELEITVQPPAGPQDPVSFQASLNSAFDESIAGFGFGIPRNTNSRLPIPDVFPGRYYLKISATVNGRSFGSYDLIDVTNEESVHKVTVELHPSVDIHGVVQMEGPSAIDMKALHISLNDNQRNTTANAAIQSNGAFVISNVQPGRWSVEIRSAPEDSYIKSVSYGGTNVLDDSLIVDGRSTQQLRIIMGAKAAEVFGTVTGANGGKVLLAPAQLNEREELYRVSSVAADGTFRIRGIPSGSYKLFAFRTLEDDAWLDPGFRDSIRSSGKPLELRDGSQTRAALTIVSPKANGCGVPVQ
jgi:hypothetical protein